MTVPKLQFRPLLIGDEYKDRFILFRINLKWFLQRTPMLLFAIVASYGVGSLLHLTGIPFPVDWIGAISFDVGFLGAIALADMQLKTSKWSIAGYYVLNCSMAGLSALFNTLAHAGGKYANITPEAITVGIPFAIVGLAFAFYYHSVMMQALEAEADQAKKEEKDLQQTQEPCKYCGVGKPSKQAVYGHYRSCEMKQMHDRSSATNLCKCLLCKAR
jgi:hypothetical protein